jgi:hypothetical protein
MKNFFFTYCFILLSCIKVFGQSHDVVSEFEQIDVFARMAPKNIETIDNLVKYLSEKATTDIEKARLIYVWLADNISYDERAYNSNSIGDNSAQTVFKTKKAVCAGFANLYTEIGEKMGLEIVTVAGVAKGYEFEEDLTEDLDESVNHAWNLIKINNEWRVFDATWGEGYGSSNKKGKLQMTKKFNANWFNVHPNVAIFTHLPQDFTKQYINPTISYINYLALPYLTPGDFNTGWITPEEILVKMNEKKKLDLPNIYSEFFDLKLRAPKERILKKGKPHEFSLKSKDVQKVFIYVNEEEIIPFIFEGESFKYTLNTKTTGSYNVVIMDHNNDLYTIFEYTVE